jgi:hypothetical protein
MNWFVSFLAMVFRPVIGLISMTGLLLFWILKRKLLRENSLKLIAYIFSGAIIFQSIFSTIFNWWLWSQQGITQQFLPPHTSIAYILKYSWQHYWFEPVIVIFAAIIAFFGIYLLNKKFENQLFYDEEKYLAALGILATGWPNCLIYLSLVLFLGVIFHFLFLFINFIRERKMKPGRRTLEAPPLVMRPDSIFRLSLLYFWLPCALLVLLLGAIINKYIIINQLVI